MTPEPMLGRVWRLAWPLILSSVSVPLLGVVDTAVMGHMPDPAYLGAVAVGALIFDFVYWAFGFLRMGTTSFTAQAVGAEDAEALRWAALRPLAAAVIIGGVLFAAQWPIRTVAIELMDPGAQLEPMVAAYFNVRIWAAPFVLINYVLLGWFIGTQRPKLALATQLLANCLNIGFDLLFVMGLGWGVEGVALGSVLAQAGSAIVGGVLFMRLAGPIRVEWATLLAPEPLRQLWQVNRDIFIRTLGLMMAFAWFTAQGARFGKVLLAANAVLFNLQLVMAYALDGFAHAAEVVVGEQLARPGRDRRPLRVAVGYTMGISVILALGFTLLWAVAGEAVIDRLTDLEAVRGAARRFLSWAVVLPLVSVWCFQLDGICIGAMQTRAMRNGMIVSLLGFMGATTLLMPSWGNDGLWAAFVFFFFLRGVTLLPSLWRVLRA